jgi:RNA polymerase sigma-70 factor (ECF subfamily)
MSSAGLESLEVAFSAPQKKMVRTTDAAAFEKIYQQYFEFTWCNLRRLGVAPAQLDDAVQDVFIVVYRRLPEFEGRSLLRTWIAGIAWRVARDYHRQRKRKGGGLPLPETLADHGPDPQQAAIHSEALKDLDYALAQLDEEKRAVFVFAELEQMNVPEIAEALELNLNTVYSRLRAARKIFESTVLRIRRAKWGAK